MGQESLSGQPLTTRCAHLCIDMQNLFAEATEWQAPWMRRVLPVVERLVAAHPDRTVFTRFIPAAQPGEGHGTWRGYWERWHRMTRASLPPGMIDLVPALARFVPPARIIDKKVYSPWVQPELDALLQERGIDTVIVTGAETDVCVLATVLGAVDRGYRVVVPTDAICSSADATHDAMLTLYRDRYGQQVQAVTAEEVLRAWR
ncbi:cysteine hydrolase [Roseomonas sp. OT10]|uniref:cysteine hydrolase family protein n=1 Tax=Roseomonas cutis TaxID=2897332 RepID=UPI001E5B9E55|nr:cysteine hydrolase [Roseomonas sp. OT10]UFN49971.1 cysteine hydrolase [Roseomonas sp. OT10]